MTHPAIRTDAETLLSNIPAELQSAFDAFLTEHCADVPFGRFDVVSNVRAAFHYYCRNTARCEPSEGTQLERLLDVAGYLPEWTKDKSGRAYLIVRGIRLTQEDDAA
ncbi:hypothetical protein OG911_25315 [Streptomyces sp. NBC_00208]|uniref:hypothetical protein n=1 Tax=Streptomyces sp. NBC_00208 TaxID=2975681 RepID=UPI002E2E0C2C|nr:hypothetical protein [Streptomyces sp. NBC_00208]